MTQRQLAIADKITKLIANLPYFTAIQILDVVRTGLRLKDLRESAPLE
jgi:hypothetical protein